MPDDWDSPDALRYLSKHDPSIRRKLLESISGRQILEGDRVRSPAKAQSAQPANLLDRRRKLMQEIELIDRELGGEPELPASPVYQPEKEQPDHDTKK